MREAETRTIGQDEKCPACGDTGQVWCHHEGTGRDEDGWCTECDSPTDQPEWIICPVCQP